MHYYIDGYNMLFHILHSAEDLKTQREFLIHDLHVKSSALNLPLALVFDSHYQKDDNSTRSHLDNLEIIYTSKGETADEYILHMLKDVTQPSNYIIVTSDKKLAWLCRRRFAKTQDIEEFISLLNRRYKNKQRQRKIEKKETVQGTPQKTTTLEAKSPLKKTVSKSLSTEECFDFYLETFEKLDAESSQEIDTRSSLSSPSQTPADKSKKRSKKPSKQEDPLISDMQRWLRAFEDPLETERDRF